MTPAQQQHRVQTAHNIALGLMDLLPVGECLEIAATLLGEIASRLPVDAAPDSEGGRIRDGAQQGVDALLRVLRSGVVIAPVTALPVNGRVVRA